MLKKLKYQLVIIVYIVKYLILGIINSKFNFNIENKTFAAQNTVLTKREKEILKFIAIGDRIEVISQKLKISESTIKNHKTQIFKKLHVSNNAEAVFYASKQNMI